MGCVCSTCSWIYYILWTKPKEYIQSFYNSYKFKKYLKKHNVSYANTRNKHVLMVEYAVGTRLYKFPIRRKHSIMTLLSVSWYQSTDVFVDYTDQFRPILGPNEDLYGLSISPSELFDELTYGFVRFEYLNHTIDVNVDEKLNILQDITDSVSDPAELHDSSEQVDLINQPDSTDSKTSDQTVDENEPMLRYPVIKYDDE